MAKRVLIGGGGHARVVYDALASTGNAPDAYCDPISQSWLGELGVAHIAESDVLASLASEPELVMGFLGIKPESLATRFEKFQGIRALGGIFPPVVHGAAWVSPYAIIEEGAQVLTGAIVHSGARVCAGAVVNTAAVVEHGAVVGAGTHIAPRAVVLGDAHVGAGCFVGSGAVVVQQAKIEPGQFIKALTTFR